MHRKMRIMLVLLLLLVPFRAAAAEGNGSIRLNMRYSGGAVPGGTVTLYPVTDREEAANARNPAEYAQSMGLPGTTQTVGEDGTVTFSGLEPGHYLLVQQEAAAGYLTMKPFCISLPMSVGGELVYDIIAEPKLERIPGGQLPQTGQLVWPIWVLLGGGFSLIGLGILVRKRK